MTENAVDVIAITGSDGELREPEWLRRAETVHRQLRPQLPADYAAKMAIVFRDGGRMIVAVRDGQVIGLAVFRMFENTHVGRRFYIDDLVTDERARSTGTGHALLAWLERLAQDCGCPGMDLESGTHRTRAHRFYFREDFYITAFSFRKEFK